MWCATTFHGDSIQPIPLSDLFSKQLPLPDLGPNETILVWYLVLEIYFFISIRLSISLRINQELMSMVVVMRLQQFDISSQNYVLLGMK